MGLLTLLSISLFGCNKSSSSNGNSSVLSSSGREEAEDLREYQHGIDILPLPSGQYCAIWASSGNPPKGSDANGNWTHDIYYALVDPDYPQINSSSATTLISNPEAQEPASAAINSTGTIMVTCEDGWNVQNEVGQRYGVYSAELRPVKAYPQLVLDGGHSGHVAAAGNYFVVFYADDWFGATEKDSQGNVTWPGIGVDGLGCGDDVYARIYDQNGTYIKTVDVASEVDDGTARDQHLHPGSLDWWPLIAASDSKTLLVWQRYAKDQQYSQLMIAVLDPASGALSTLAKLMDQIKYYTYNVTHLKNIDRFLVTGTTYGDNKGFAYLLDGNGSVVAQTKSLPATVRGAKAVVRANGSESVVVQPASPSGLMVLSVTANSITLKKTIVDAYNWSYCGTDGLFNSSGTQVYFASLSKTGMVQRTFTLTD